MRTKGKTPLFRVRILGRLATVGLLAVQTIAGGGGCGRASITFALGGDDGTIREKVVMEEGTGVEGVKVALIDVRGLIVDDRRSALLSDGVNPVDDLTAKLEKAARDGEVRAVVLRINSPGGGVAASETMYSEVRRFREKTGKPVVVSMGEVAASGGYYLALAGDEVFAQPTTITGSIGVIVPTVNISGALNRWGVVSRSVKSGANKDLANPLEPMRDGQYAVLQGMVDEFYAAFRGLVVERRTGKGLESSRIDELTDGRVVTGAEAHRAGLVDHLGGVREALARAAELAGAKRARLVKYYGGSESPPRSAYALAEPGAAEINLLKVEVPELLLGVPASAGGYYYLWAPGAP